MRDLNPYEYKPPVATEDNSPLERRKTAPRRALELTIGLATLVSGLAMAGLASLPFVRVIQQRRVGEYFPDAFELILLVVAVPLLVIAWRLIRGHGVNYGPRLLSPIGMSLAGIALLLCSVGLVWGGVETGDWSFWGMAALSTGLTATAFWSAWRR